MLLNFREEKKGEIEREQLREIIEIARETILYIILIEEGERLLREEGGVKVKYIMEVRAGKCGKKNS